MLNSEANRNIQVMKEEAFHTWGSNCEFGAIDIKNSPYPEFELRLRLYQKVEVGIYYDRSAFDIGIGRDGRFVLLGKFTSKPVFRGMKAMIPENLRHNFQVLDEVARELIAGNI